MLKKIWEILALFQSKKDNFSKSDKIAVFSILLLAYFRVSTVFLLKRFLINLNLAYKLKSLSKVFKNLA